MERDDGPDIDAHRPGDKVRVRSGSHAGTRGNILRLVETRIEIATEAADLIQVADGEVTNYSRAARRAWRTMPKQAGRPPASGTVKKRMVSLRLDADIWAGLGEAVEQGLIPSREQAVNSWLRERLRALLDERPDRSGSGE